MPEGCVKFQAVLFDLDGTLLDTIDDLTDSMNAVLARRGRPQHSREDYKIFVGSGTRELVRLALPDACRDETTVTQCEEELKVHYEAHCMDRTRPFEGIDCLLDALTKRGLRMAILSNKPDAFVQRLVRALLPRWAFDVVQGELPGIPKKPDPAVPLMIARRLGVEPAQILYIGDSGIDMETAANAGMYPVGVLWGFRGERELRSHGARLLFSQPHELLSLLKDGTEGAR